MIADALAHAEPRRHAKAGGQVDTRLGDLGAVQAFSGRHRGSVDFECVGHGFTPENVCLQPSLCTQVA